MTWIAFSNGSGSRRVYEIKTVNYAIFLKKIIIEKFKVKNLTN